MLKNSLKQQKLRQYLYNNELHHISYVISKMYLPNDAFPYLFRYLQYIKMLTVSSSKIKRVCFLTGRSRSVYRDFKISRLKIRQYASAGYFVGISKASW